MNKSNHKKMVTVVGILLGVIISLIWPKFALGIGLATLFTAVVVIVTLYILWVFDDEVEDSFMETLKWFFS